MPVFIVNWGFLYRLQFQQGEWDESSQNQGTNGLVVKHESHMCLGTTTTCSSSTSVKAFAPDFSLFLDLEFFGKNDLLSQKGDLFSALQKFPTN